MEYTEAEKKQFMQEALKEAKKAQVKDEVPIGAVIVLDRSIVGRGHNLRETTQNATTHAEMIAIQDANKQLENWRLEDCDLFVTLEPCAMCSGAMILSRIRKVYYGAPDPKGGTVESIFNLLDEDKFNHRVTYERGVLEEECGEILTEFFRNLRKRNKQKKQLQNDEKNRI
ncbi:tRNA adenosine(34) deaminase TadA [Lacticigenium naphthae]|uniref:tRNA adenosine(34) deaminase TadA n=1 Tax=Lacticigenium naphthae TaxID=515351 RepID=UPI000409BB4C|nr:tRNA adenosine(34) deaminase TadA [Lacticigenium naphthae]